MSEIQVRVAPASPPRPRKSPPPHVVPSPRIPARARDRAGGGDAILERFWTEVAAEGTPLVERAAGASGRCIVTFLWRDRHGRDAGTSGVVLMANKLTDPSVWRESNLERLAGTDVWHRSFEIGSDWRATYQLAVDDGYAPADDGAPVPPGPRRRWDRVSRLAGPDPLNTRTFPAKRGGPDTSVVELPAAPPQPWSRPHRDRPAGTVTTHRVTSSALGNSRDVWMYLPPGGGAGGPCSVALLLDGEDWVSRLDAATIFDNLIAAGAIPPTVAIMPHALDVPTRWREMTANDAFVAFVADELLPWAAARYPLTADPARTVVAGQSIGGLSAAHLALCAPHRIGATLIQSASLWWAPDEREHWLARRFADAPQSVDVYLEVGLEEWTLLEDHRHLHRSLRAHGHPVTYREYNGGHDALCWRGGLADGLIALERMRAARA